MIHKNIRFLTWFNFFTDFKLYSPVAIIYFSHVSNSYALGMMVFSIAWISSALLEIPTGAFSDYVGRRKTLILGAASAVIYSVFYAIGQSFWILAVGALFEGLSRSFYSGNNDALLHDTLAEKGATDQYAEFLGRVSAAFQVALAISAIMGSILANFSFSLIMWLSVVPQIACFILSFLIADPKVRSDRSGNLYYHLKDSLLHILRNKKLRLLTLAHMLREGLVETSFQFQAAFFNTVLPVWTLGIVKSLSHVLASFGFRLSGKIINKFGAIESMIGSHVYNRIASILALLFPTPFSPFLMSTTSLFYGVNTVSKNTLMQKEFTAHQRATLGSINSFAGSIFLAFPHLYLVLWQTNCRQRLHCFFFNFFCFLYY